MDAEWRGLTCSTTAYGLLSDYGEGRSSSNNWTFFSKQSFSSTLTTSETFETAIF